MPFFAIFRCLHVFIHISNNHKSLFRRFLFERQEASLQGRPRRHASRKIWLLKTSHHHFVIERVNSAQFAISPT